MNGPGGDGIVTAGHYQGLELFEQPGVSPDGMTHHAEVYGAEGDAEYHTTDHEERAEFYAGNLRRDWVPGTNQHVD